MQVQDIDTKPKFWRFEFLDNNLWTQKPWRMKVLHPKIWVITPQKRRFWVPMEFWFFEYPYKSKSTRWGSVWPQQKHAPIENRTNTSVTDRWFLDVWGKKYHTLSRHEFMFPPVTQKLIVKSHPDLVGGFNLKNIRQFRSFPQEVENKTNLNPPNRWCLSGDLLCPRLPNTLGFGGIWTPKNIPKRRFGSKKATTHPWSTPFGNPPTQLWKDSRLTTYW